MSTRPGKIQFFKIEKFTVLQYSFCMAAFKGQKIKAMYKWKVFFNSFFFFCYTFLRETHTLGKEQEGKQMGRGIWRVLFFLALTCTIHHVSKTGMCCQGQNDSLASDQHEQ